MTPGRRPQLEMRPPAEARHRKLSAPADTSPSAVAEALDKVFEAKRARRVQPGGGENPQPFPSLTSSPSANTVFRESHSAASPVASPSANTVFRESHSAASPVAFPSANTVFRESHSAASPVAFPSANTVFRGSHFAASPVAFPSANTAFRGSHSAAS